MYDGMRALPESVCLLKSLGLHRRNFAGTALHASTPEVTDPWSAPANPSGRMIERSPTDCPLAAAVAVAITTLIVEVDVGFIVSKVRYSVLTPIHYFPKQRKNSCYAENFSPLREYELEDLLL
jgi:hypothetical protein